MEEAFDSIAENYDNSFTNTIVGKAQRNSVYRILDKLNFANKSILELNCGTGEDAFYFAEKGCKVIATDISSEMIKCCETKKKSKLYPHLKFQRLDIENLNNFDSQQKFDLIFSNFGGVNCLSKNAIRKLSSDAAKLLKPNGRVVLVVMSKYCLWEIFYFTCKFKLKKAFRRIRKKSLNVSIGSSKIETFYYTPKTISTEFKGYKMITKKIVNFAIPPSYVNSYFERHTKMLDFLTKIDKSFSFCKFLSVFSDHFLIELKKEN